MMSLPLRILFQEDQVIRQHEKYLGLTSLVGPVLVKVRGALKRKGLLEPRRKVQSTSARLIEVKCTFLKNNFKNFKNYN